MDDGSDSAGDAIGGGTLVLPEVHLWAAAHTKARSEKVVADHFRKRGVEHFLPVVLNRRRYGARIRDSWLPLFPGYVFYDFEAIDRRRVFDTRRVAKILVPEEPQQLSQDLHNLAAALAVEPTLRRRELGPPGTPVEVIAGPLVGRTGRLVRQEGGTLLLIAVDFIGFGAEVAIDESCVRPLGGKGT